MPGIALVVALLGLSGCGGGSREPGWVEVSPAAPLLGAGDVAAPASARPASHAGSTEDAEDAKALEAAILRAQQRLGQAPALIGLMNPMGGQTDIPEAARRTTKLMGECRADQALMGQIADRLAERWPDPARAPASVLLVQTRAAAYRYREWALVELLRATDRTAQDLLARGTPSTAELLLAAAALDGLRYTHEGAILLRRYLALAPVALARAARPEEKLPDVAVLLYDTRIMAFAWGPSQWNEKEAPEVRKLVAAFRAAATSLPGPAGPPIGRLITRWWDWGETGSADPLPAAQTAAAAADLREIARALPAGAQMLEGYAAQVAAGQ